ncbi:hypothetical protein BaRGS_00010122 [Batillaria attramentaria]|uniref:Uncharacterized protein n=1 Tax=Batillaria attramentaria TaxID=370345 RepID=A0ABD0LH72_9CAEN
MAEKPLLDPVGSDDDASFQAEPGTQMYASHVPPAYAPPMAPPPGAVGGPPGPMGGYVGGPMGPVGGAVGGPMGSGHPPPQPHANTTTVIINQPAPMSMSTGPRDWSSGMCSCCDDMGSCLLGTFCPCILASQVAGDMDESICVPCCVPGWLIVLRTKLRADNNITGTVMDDCCKVCCCGNCVLCQMARELKFIRMSYRPAF